MSETERAQTNDFDMNALNEIVHGRVRLGVLACLAGGETLEFNTLRTRLRTTDGTLSVHLRKLEDAGFIEIEKGYNGRRPVTRLRMSSSGQRAFKEYLLELSRLMELGNE